MTAAARRRLLALAAMLVLVALPACGGSTNGSPTTTAAGTPTTAANDTTSITTAADAPLEAGAERLHYKFGPIAIKPGQNNIDYSGGAVPKPDVDGWIVRMTPNLRRADGSVPGVDVIHLHHGVWLNASRRDSTVPTLPERFFAVGEEKTTMVLPEGYGYRYKASDNWVINYMIHNLIPTPDQVWITYDIDFIPATAPQAANIKEARPVWMDVQNGSVYPVFDTLRGTGSDGLYTYPTDAGDAYNGKAPLNQWVVDRDSVLIATAGHLHPGGLYNDLDVSRSGQTARAFRSEAHYFEPAGAVSWDVAMTTTQPDWRVAVKAGDVLSTTATYDVRNASWYESMGIMIVWATDAANATGADPFTSTVDGPGILSHGHLPENDNHGGALDALPDPRNLPTGQAAGNIPIKDFTYEQGDYSEGPADIPTVAAGQSITFDNQDAPVDNGIWHTITACEAPCNSSTGIAYPLANGSVQFDSGELGAAGPPSSGYTTWQTPATLPPGTYTYFCRIHPFIRGAFRVVPPQ